MIANCKQCGRLFNKTLSDICPSCMELEEEQFEAVRAYLKENKLATMVDVIEAVEVTTEQLIEWIDSGRLILRDNPNFSIQCERCQLPTQSGRYCPSCKDEMYTVFADATEKVKKLKQHQPGSSTGYYSR